MAGASHIGNTRWIVANDFAYVEGREVKNTSERFVTYQEFTRMRRPLVHGVVISVAVFMRTEQDEQLTPTTVGTLGHSHVQLQHPRTA